VAVPTVTALRQAIRAYLDEEGASPADQSLSQQLRQIDTTLGTVATRDDNPSPGRIAARLAGSTEKQPSGKAKPDTPGKDLNNVQRPGGDKPFAGIKRPETARALARMRFTNDKQVHNDAQKGATAEDAKGSRSAVGVGRE
jgi:hypothetical protein